MEEVKIWAIGDSHAAEPLESKSQVETEALLEETLVSNPDLLIQGLKLVGRQTPTEGGPLDLLGVDTDGRLVVFELKRGTLSRDAVAQVVDYASYLDAMDLVELAEYISERSGEHGIDNIEDFQDWYSRQDFGELESLKPLRLFLVGLGTDDRTERMVRFLADNSSMDISLLTFHGFEHDGKILLAKQVEVEGAAEPEHRPRRRMSAAEKREKLAKLLADSGVHELFQAVRSMFQENWPESRLSPVTWWSRWRSLLACGLGVRLKGQRALYARIDPGQGKVGIVFFPRAKALCLDEFRQPVQEIPCQTWPKNREPLEDADVQIQFSLTAEEWETHKESLYKLTKAVYEAWESREQDGDLPDSESSSTEDL